MMSNNATAIHFTMKRIEAIPEVKRHLHIVLCGDNINAVSILRSLGEVGLRPTVIMAVGVCASRLLWVWLVLPHWRSVATLAWCYPMSWVITAFAFVVYYLKSGWLERSAVRSGHVPASDGHSA